MKHLNGQSLPTKDLGPRQGKTSLGWELIKLQNELKVFVQKVEELACRGKTHKNQKMTPALISAHDTWCYVGGVN